MNGMVFTHLVVVIGAGFLLGWILGSLLVVPWQWADIPMFMVMIALLGFIAVDQLLSAYDRWGKGRERP